MKYGAGTSGELDREYKRCLVRERDRYREWAKTRQGKFETYRILHFDAEAEEAVDRDRSTSWLGDRGKGAAAVRRCADGIRGTSAAQKVNRARMRVSRRLPHCKTVFRLVLKYGTNWRESVGQLVRLRRGMTLQAAKRLYRRQLWQLVELLERSGKKTYRQPRFFPSDQTACSILRRRARAFASSSSALFASARWL